MSKIFQIKILLQNSKPRIWRRVLINQDINFKELHHIIQDAMGWRNCHLYEFRPANNISIGIPFEDFYQKTIDAATVKIKKYLKKEGDKIRYNYDFGDDWQHTITVEKVEAADPSKKYPTCIKGKNNCPPEDCGGVWGYQTLLETIQDTKHPDHKNMMRWLGGPFDPEAFDMEVINYRLKKYQKT